MPVIADASVVVPTGLTLIQALRASIVHPSVYVLSVSFPPPPSPYRMSQRAEAFPCGYVGTGCHASQYIVHTHFLHASLDLVACARANAITPSCPSYRAPFGVLRASFTVNTNPVLPTLVGGAKVEADCDRLPTERCGARQRLDWRTARPIDPLAALLDELESVGSMYVALA